ncbi:hypothetical protein V1511DRAFT_494651 [Dipodascopsis uninucleata]
MMLSLSRNLAISSRQIVVARKQVMRRFHASVWTNTASNFAMPALSPTMTEGGISEWKIKEGESFSAGDIILEIETDKAQMDVEAPDDGILVKIYSGAGSKEIPVGTTIAVIAEPDDDITSLDIPVPVTKDSTAAPAEQAAPEPPAAAPPKAEPVKTEPVTAKVSSVEGNKANPNQTLFPSVLSLLQTHHMSEKEAVEKIPASGPKGRILKGDVLAYFGAIASKTVENVNKIIKEREHLDLSNIKLAAPKSKEEQPAKEEKSKSLEKPKVVVNFDELLTFNPPRKITKTIIRPPQAIETIVVSPKSAAKPVEAPITPTTEAANEAAAPVKSTKPKMSRYDEIFNELVSVPKYKQL